LWFDSNGDKVREAGVHKPGGIELTTWDVADTIQEVSGSDSTWTVIACYEDFDLDIGMEKIKNVFHVDSLEFRIADCPCKDVVSFSVVYDGPAVDELKVEGKEVAVQILTNVVPGDVIVVEPKDGKNKLGNEVKFKFKDGDEIKIHTSCSRPIDEGDVHTDGDKVLTITELDVIVDKNKCDECDAVASMTVRYNGPDGVDMAIDVGGPGQMETDVQDGDEITVLPEDGKDKLRSNTTFDITNGGLDENIEIHTSCSRPIAVGDVHSSGGATLTITDLDLIPK
jgi:hypothetical protein